MDDRDQRAAAAERAARGGGAVARETFREPVAGDDVDSREAVPETGATWIVDPIDGTANYVRGLAAWASCVAAVVDATAERVGDVRRLGSMRGTLALVAAGGLDAAVALGRQYPWDTIAGVHLIRCAGGAVTDVRGDRWRHDSTGFVASNGEAHEAVLDAVRDGLGCEGA